MASGVPKWLKVALSLAAAAGLAQALKLYLKFLEVTKRKLARKALADRTRASMKILHVAVFMTPELQENSPAHTRLAELYKKANKMPGFAQQLERYGSRLLAKEQFLAELARPDLSLGFSHMSLIVADNTQILRDFLHGPLHNEISPVIGQYIKGLIIVDCPLGVDLVASEDAVVSVILLRFGAHVTDESPLYAEFLKAVAGIGQASEVSAALAPVGSASLCKDDFLKEISRPDLSLGITHVLTIAAKSFNEIRAAIHSPAYGEWLKVEMPHLVNDGAPSALVFYSPLTISATR